MYKYINRTVLPASPPGYPRHDTLGVAERGSIGLARPSAQGRAMDDKMLKKLLKDHSACMRDGEEKGRQAVLIGADLHSANLSEAILFPVNLKNALLDQTGPSEADLRSANLTNANLGGTEIWWCAFKDCAIEPATLHTLLDSRTA